MKTKKLFQSVIVALVALFTLSFISCEGNSALNQLIEKANKECPTDVEEGMTIVSVAEEGDNVVYTVEMDEELYDVDLLKQNVAGGKAGIVEMLDDETTKEELKVLASANRGLVYRYIGDKSRKSVDIEFSAEELKAYIN